ncbi:MAG: tRNA guanosine(34) transglycosylase Tgt [Pirellulales bacterium]|nr:tRNA guanosine(34) transglycosylase Tgt [Pirellulales bacterium]
MTPIPSTSQRSTISTPFSFRLLHADAQTAARRSAFSTPHGDVQMPAFMPVGTQATVKGLEIDQLQATGAEMVLANTYHLALRPGEETVAALGGLHQFMGWPGPMLTDSGGFQLFSLAHRVKIGEEEAVFRSHIDGSLLAVSPERAVAIQEALGADVAMALDHVVELPNKREVVRDAMDRTVRWARRCRDAATREDQAIFAIVQGGLDADLRADCARRLREMDFPGYAIGGLSVGEEPPDMLRMIEATVAELPGERPRYLMGVGRPEDIIEAVRRGVDLFDCVMPTRNGRNAMAFTDSGTLRLRNAKYERDDRPLQPGCPCAACRRGRGYIRHLFMAGEMLGPILLTIHNLTYYQRLLSDARRAIEADRFEEFRREKLAGWGVGVEHQ